jgi:hypothetical protein
MTYAQRRTEELVDDLNRSADALDRDAEDLRGRGDPADHADVALRKHRAAQDVRDYANRLSNGTEDVNAAEAEAVANAARCSGILTDGRRFAESQNYWTGDDRQAAIDHENAKVAAIEASGMFTRVAEDGQVPFYALNSYGGWYGNREATTAADDTAEA